ncbi:hypothetical protein ALMP_37720 [Streptomyces sp. A012304]|nr:hypothetical protein ALMP_37720 [Streptomyces sp. A012304]
MAGAPPGRPGDLKHRKFFEWLRGPLTRKGFDSTVPSGNTITVRDDERWAPTEGAGNGTPELGINPLNWSTGWPVAY